MVAFTVIYHVKPQLKDFHPLLGMTYLRYQVQGGRGNKLSSQLSFLHLLPVPRPTRHKFSTCLQEEMSSTGRNSGPERSRGLGRSLGKISSHLEHGWTPIVWDKLNSHTIPPRFPQGKGLVLIYPAWCPKGQGLMVHGPW